MFEIGSVVAILVLSTIAEAIVEYFIAPLVKPPTPPEPEDEGPEGLDWRSLVLRYSAAAIAIALCIVYKADVLALLGMTAGWPIVGQVVTGILVGRGSNYINDFADTWLSRFQG